MAFHEIPGVREIVLLLLFVTFVAFVALFAIKAFQDPEFCRSESHIQRMKKLELEFMGSESEILPAEVVEEEVAIEASPSPPMLHDNIKGEPQRTYT